MIFQPEVTLILELCHFRFVNLIYNFRDRSEGRDEADPHLLASKIRSNQDALEITNILSPCLCDENGNKKKKCYR